MPAGCVQAFPLKHRVPCCGYAFTLPRAGKFDPQRAKAAGIPVRYWSTLQSGQPVGGFLPLGALIAAMQWALAKSEKKKEVK